MKKKLTFILMFLSLAGISQTFQSKIILAPTSSSWISVNGSALISVYAPTNITQNGTTTSSCDTWFKTDQGAGIDYILNGSSVSQWNNRGTLSLNGTQTTGSLQYTLYVNALNGINGLYGANYNWYGLTGTYTPNLNESSFCIAKVNEGLSYGIASLNNGSGYLLSLGTTSIGANYTGILTTTSSINASNYNFTGYVNLITSGIFYGSNNISVLTTGFNNVINCSRITYNIYNAYLLEIWTHNKSLSLAEVNYLRQYVCSKYAMWTCEWLDKNNKSNTPFPVYFAYNDKFTDSSRVDLYYSIGNDLPLEPIHLHVTCERLEELYGEINTQNWIDITKIPKSYVPKYVDKIPYINLFTDNSK